MKVIKHHEFRVMNIEGGIDNLVGIVKFPKDLRVVDGYFQVFSIDDRETVIGVRADKVFAYRLVPITEEANFNSGAYRDKQTRAEGT